MVVILIQQLVMEKTKHYYVLYSNKCNVNRLDQLCSFYDVTRNSRRWSLAIFFNVIHFCGINSMNVYSANKNYAKVDLLETFTLCFIIPNTKR